MLLMKLALLYDTLWPSFWVSEHASTEWLPLPSRSSEQTLVSCVSQLTLIDLIISWSLNAVHVLCAVVSASNLTSLEVVRWGCDIDTQGLGFGLFVQKSAGFLYNMTLFLHRSEGLFALGFLCNLEPSAWHPLRLPPVHFQSASGLSHGLELFGDRWACCSGSIPLWILPCLSSDCWSRICQLTLSSSFRHSKSAVKRGKVYNKPHPLFVWLFSLCFWFLFKGLTTVV